MSPHLGFKNVQCGGLCIGLVREYSPVSLPGTYRCACLKHADERTCLATCRLLGFWYLTPSYSPPPRLPPTQRQLLGGDKPSSGVGTQVSPATFRPCCSWIAAPQVCVCCQEGTSLLPPVWFARWPQSAKGKPLVIASHLRAQVWLEHSTG
jgi:hypothetical protein